MSICNLGVMATEYVRDIILPTSISIEQKESRNILVDQIYSKWTIGNELDIILRQKEGNEIPWVTIEQGSPSRVFIDSGNTVPGHYTLILQSFDNNGSVKSTLKEDTITITI